MSLFMATTYCPPYRFATPAPRPSARETWRGSTPSKRWLSWIRKPGPLPRFDQIENSA